MSTNSRNAVFGNSGPFGFKPLSPLHRAKALINIFEAWQRLGLPGQPSNSCRNPSRDDRNPSLSIFADGRLFKDHATNQKGDVVAFIAMVSNVSDSDAAKKLIAMAGTKESTCATVIQPPRAHTTKETREKPSLPELRKPTQQELLEIGRQRNLPIVEGHYPGLEVAVQRGLLWVGSIYDHIKEGALRAWIVTDDSRWNAQARRMDGQPWLMASGNTTKAKTLRGSSASWPIGAANLQAAKWVLLTEGPPDLLAAFTAVQLANSQRATNVDQFGFVCVAGAKNQLHPDALPYFAGKRVRIIPHNDASGTGISAAASWASQLRKAGASVDWFDLSGLNRPDGMPAKDLNDLIHCARSDETLDPQSLYWLCELTDFGFCKSEVSQ